VTIADVASAAKVSPSTIYATFKSRDGILRALMERALFGPHYAAAIARLEGETDPVRLIGLSASVARAIYDGESRELGPVREIAAGSSTLRSVEREFEDRRYALQKDRVRRLFETGRARAGLDVERARRILWMYTSRDVYRMLVIEAGWTPAAYESWLADTLRRALVAPQAQGSR
jgi:AcrR family transcriptional regulator